MSKRLKKIARQNGETLTLYDEEILESQCMKLKLLEKGLKEGLVDTNVSIHCQITEYCNPQILNVIKKCGLKVECISPWEVKVAEIAGYAKDDILFSTCNGNISPREMSVARDDGVLICVDSVSQIEAWAKVCRETSRKKQVIIQIPQWDILEAEYLFRTADECRLKIVGIYQPMVSVSSDEDVPFYITNLKFGIEMVENLKPTEIICFEAKILPNEKLSLEFLKDKIKPVLQEFKLKFPSIKEFKFVIGSNFLLPACKVVGVVTSLKYKEHWSIRTNIGIKFHEGYHEILLPERHDGPRVVATICGDSGDIIESDYELFLPRLGDLIIISNTTLSPKNTNRPIPAEVMKYSDGSIKLIKKSQSFDDFMSTFC